MLSPKVLTPSSILDSFADLKKQLDNNLNGRKVPILGITVIFYSLLLSLFLVIIKRKISKIVPPLVCLDFLPEPTTFFLRGSRVKFKPVHVCFDSARCINEGFEIEGARMLTWIIFFGRGLNILINNAGTAPKSTRINLGECLTQN